MVRAPKRKSDSSDRLSLSGEPLEAIEEEGADPSYDSTALTGTNPTWVTGTYRKRLSDGELSERDVSETRQDIPPQPKKTKLSGDQCSSKCERPDRVKADHLADVPFGLHSPKLPAPRTPLIISTGSKGKSDLEELQDILLPIRAWSANLTVAAHDLPSIPTSPPHPDDVHRFNEAQSTLTCDCLAFIEELDKSNNKIDQWIEGHTKGLESQNQEGEALNTESAWAVQELGRVRAKLIEAKRDSERAKEEAKTNQDVIEELKKCVAKFK